MLVYVEEKKKPEARRIMEKREKRWESVESWKREIGVSGPVNERIMRKKERVLLLACECVSIVCLKEWYSVQF